jgi:hypothetical protein
MTESIDTLAMPNSNLIHAVKELYLMAYTFNRTEAETETEKRSRGNSNSSRVG